MHTFTDDELTAHDARVKAEAVREAAEDPAVLLPGHNGVIGKAQLLNRADRIEQEARR